MLSRVEPSTFCVWQLNMGVSWTVTETGKNCADRPLFDGGGQIPHNSEEGCKISFDVRCAQTNAGRSTPDIYSCNGKTSSIGCPDVQASKAPTGEGRLS